jgi:ArsR family transcriptional regulator
MNSSHTKLADSELVEVFSALGDKTRFRLLELLIKEEDICVSELAAQVSISNAGVSQQLKILEKAGLITRTRQGQRICYEVNRKSSQAKQILSVLGY